MARHARPIFRPPMRRTSCAIASATSCSCGRSRPPSPSATRCNQTALPIRTWGSFMPPNGVGGGGVHWNARNLALPAVRFRAEDASDAALRRRVPARGHDDPGLGRHLRRARAALRHVRISVRHVGHGRQSQGPDPGGRQSRSRGRARGPIRRRRRSSPSATRCSAKAARELGYKPFPQPSGNLSQAYTNPLGVTLGPCTYCGFCEWFGCGNYSKASPQTTILPVLVRKSNFTARDNSRGDAHQLSTAPASAPPASPSSIRSGEEWEQPADLVILSRLHDVQRAAAAALEDRHALRSRRQ